MRNTRLKLSRSRQLLRNRGLRVEILEPRVLLAGDTYLVNFQSDEATPVTRYLVDNGNVFGPRGGVLSYGWSTDHSDQSRERSATADQRLDTLIHFEAGQNWEFQLANGVYEVTVAVGDPANNDGVHTVNVEGVNLFNAVPDTNNAMVMTDQVTVSDGRLTIDQGAAADKATRINYVHIVGLPSGPNTPPATPTINEPATDGEVVNPSGVHMEATGFTDTDGNLHKSSDWEIWTVGPGAQPVWQTLGIEGLEKVHTHFGDGIFINSRAGQNSLAANSDHELRVRFRDDAGAVSAYAVRPFHTGEASSTAPLQIQDVAAAPAPTLENVFGAAIELPAGASILSPGDPIIAIDTDGGSNSPINEPPSLAIDGTLAKYLNFGEVNSGFIVTPSKGSTIVKTFQITTANDAVERDPSTWSLYGTNSAIASTNNSTGNAEAWTLIASGSVTLPGLRNTIGPTVAVNNNTAYTSYRMIFTGVKNMTTANSMQIAEIQFYGDQLGVSPSVRLQSGDTAALMLSIEGTALAGNLVNNPAALASHANVRAVIQAGTSALALEQTNLHFTDENGTPHTVFLPAINLAPNQRLDLWVAEDGSTYFGTAAQTMPDFSMLARTSENTLLNPFVATQPGFVVEEVGTNYRLPVNIAFVPNPGPDPDDPLYYVTELYGSIQVVRRDGTKQTFATGLLDYNPDGPISGTGEQGLTGIFVERNAANPEIYQLYVTMLWDNGAPPGNLVHYPKVERIDSTPGGLTMATRTLLLNMQPETQGQSHQISNISIGPDRKLYVHMGEGFNAALALNLNQFRGKILRMNLDGTAPPDNPLYNAGDGITATDYIFAYGFRNPFGGAWRASDGKHYEVENGPGTNDRLAQVNAGVSYGWNNDPASLTTNAIYNWTIPHAPVNITFVQRETFNGSQFPAGKMDHAFVSESGTTYATGAQANGKRIVEFVLDANGNRVGGPTTLVEYRGTGQGSVVGLAAGPDGLYFTELYKDDVPNPNPALTATLAGARIFRVRYVNPTPADYDIDGDVNDTDYGTWRKTFGSNVLLGADGNRNSIVDAADYVLWRRAKSTTAATAVAAIVPTPETANGASIVPQSAEAEVEQLIDQALAGLALAEPSATVTETTRRGAHHRGEVHTSKDDALLLTLRQTGDRRDTSPGANGGSHDPSAADVGFSAIDELFAEYQLELLNYC